MRWARLLLSLAAALQAGPALAAEPVRVYGLERESHIGRERLLVFAEAPVRYELTESEPGTLILAIPGAALDPSAPRRVEGAPEGSIRRVSAFERADVDTPEVRLVITTAAGAKPQVSQRGSILALDFLREEAPEQSLSLQFRDADISEVVRRVGAATGQRFLFDERLRGRVTMIVPDPLGHREAEELLHAMLLVRGFVALPTPSGALKVLPIASTPEGAPFARGARDEAGDAPITTLLRLEAADAGDVATQLGPWVGSSHVVQAFEPTNSLILAGSENGLRTLLTLVRALDAAADDAVFVRRLRHTDAPKTAEFLERMYDRPGIPPQRVAFVPDERANSLLIRVPAGIADEVKERIARLDRPAVGEGNVAVIPLRYVDAQEFGTMLGELAAGGGAEDRAFGLQGRKLGLAVDEGTHSLVASGDPETLRILRELVDELDRIPPRVSVEVLVLEVTTDRSLSLGFDALLRLGSGRSLSEIQLNPSGGGLFDPSEASSGPAGAVRVTRDPLLIPILDENGVPTGALLPVSRESYVLTADEREVSTEVLQRPHLLVASGSEQEIVAGDNIPIPVASTEQDNPLQTRQTIQRQDVGITLRVDPTVGEAGDVELGLLVETARLAPSAAGDVSQVGPTVRTRSLETRVRVADDEWVVIGLGHQPEFTDRVVGVPFVKDIPLLGNFFRRTEKRERDSELVLAVQARIGRTRDDLIADSIRRRLGFERSLTRVKGLEAERDGPVALRISSRSSEAQARAIEEAFRSDDHPPRLVSWDSDGIRHFDVLLTGFRSIAEAAAATGALAAEGWAPQIVVVPDAEPDSSALHARPSEPPTSPF